MKLKKSASKILLSLPLLLLLGISARADVLRLSPEGVAALRATGLAQRMTDGSGYVMRGRVVVQRDAGGRLTLRDPYIYFMFEPQLSVGKYGPAQKMKWTWTQGQKQEYDTLEDLRGIISNRDMRNGNWETALTSLLLEIDKDDSIYHLRAKGTAVAPGNPSIKLSEGWLSYGLLAGQFMTEAERKTYQDKLIAMPKGDPYGFRPNDPMLQVGTGSSTIDLLLEALGRGAKYGEPEPGFAAAAVKIATFICEDMYPAQDALSGPSRDKAMFIQRFVQDARLGLLGRLALYPQQLQRKLERQSRFGNGPLDKFRVDASYIAFDDSLPITDFDMARAAIYVGGELKSARDGDGGTQAIVDKFLVTASGREDFRAQDPTVKLPAEVTDFTDPIGSMALSRLVGLARSEPVYRKAIIAAFQEVTTKSAETVGAPSLVAASSEAISLTGVASASEVVLFIDGVWNIGITLQQTGFPWSANAAGILKRTAASSQPSAQATYDRYLAKKINDLKKRIELGQDGAGEREWLARMR